MAFLERIFGTKQKRERLEPLYRAAIADARDPTWYRTGGVPDTLDGRFDMLAAILSLILLRLERDETERESNVLLTEMFVADMDASLRQIGIGDFVVGKHVGRMVSALGGRLGAFRSAIEAGEGLADPVRRNVFREAPPSEDAVAFVAGRLEALDAALAVLPVSDLIAGRLPAR